MKKILILGGLSTDTEEQTEYAFGLSAFLPDYEFKDANFDHLIFSITPEKFSISDGRDGTELSDYGLVIMRGKIRRSTGLAYVLSYYLKANKIPFFNDYSRYRPSSKLAQAMLFYELGLPFIATYYSDNTELLIKTISKNLKYPIILKDTYGAHGRNNYLVKTEQELKKILAANLQIQFVAQAYHANNGDFRILVAGDQAPLVIKRTAVPGSHLNNTSQGGSAELTSEIADEFIANSKKLAKTLKMTLAGVDLLQDSNTSEMFFLEVNSQPQILSGAFTKEKERIVSQLLRGLIG